MRNKHFTNFQLLKLHLKTNIKHLMFIFKTHLPLVLRSKYVAPNSFATPTLNKVKPNILQRILSIFNYLNSSKIIEILLKAKSLPMGTRCKNKLLLLLIIILTILCYIITRDFSSELFNYNKNLAYFFSFLIYIHLIYLVVNVVLRLFNLIFKAGPNIVSYYWSNKKSNSPSALKYSPVSTPSVYVTLGSEEDYYYIVFTYVGLILIYNFISIFIMYRFLYILQLHEILFIDVNFNILMILCISTIIAFIYTKYDNPEFKISNNKLTKFMCFSLFSLFFSLFLIFIFPYIQPFLADFPISYFIQTIHCSSDNNGDMGSGSSNNSSDNRPERFYIYGWHPDPNNQLNHTNIYDSAPSDNPAPIASSSSTVAGPSFSNSQEGSDSGSSLSSSLLAEIDSDSSRSSLSSVDLDSSTDADSDYSISTTSSMSLYRTTTPTNTRASSTEADIIYDAPTPELVPDNGSPSPK
jgi:hypothetical protein